MAQRPLLTRGWIFRALLAGAFALTLPACEPQQTPQGVARTNELGVMLWAQPKPLPELRFVDSAGQQVSLADFRGKVVLLNLWATWCAPCREEMPALDTLQRQLGGPDFEVLALSLDAQGSSLVQQFYQDFGIQHLAIYVDPTTQAGVDLEAPGIPVTLLLDRQGRELGRKLGVAEWDSEPMRAFIQDVMRQPGDAAARP